MRTFLALVALPLSAAVAGCGSSSSSSPAPSASAPTPATKAAGVNPNQREALPPGDIPDRIAYVPYSVPGEGLTVSTPEGWSRSSAHGAITFTDKLNRIQLFTVPAHGTLTATSVKRTELPKIASAVKTFELQSISTVSRPAAPAVRITYLGDSQPNPVTGKVGTLAFERYDFVHNGREVVLLLSSPRGSDNVDPWRKVTGSLRFTR